jgi:hypothetical protein
MNMAVNQAGNRPAASAVNLILTPVRAYTRNLSSDKRNVPLCEISRENVQHTAVPDYRFRRYLSRGSLDQLL